MSYEHNPYYNPEKVGLEIVTEGDCADSYAFDMFVVWRHKESGKLFYATDSGCSCPTPFEGEDFSGPDRTTLRPLTPETKDEFLAALNEWGTYCASVDRDSISRAALEALAA